VGCRFESCWDRHSGHDAPLSRARVAGHLLFPAMNRDAIMTELLETDGELSLAKPTLTLELHIALGRRHGRNYGRRGYLATADGIKFVNALFVNFVAHVALLLF
jgi:hypothetical protein